MGNNQSSGLHRGDEKALSQDLALWEGFHAQLRGAREVSEVSKRALAFLGKAFQTQECLICFYDDDTGRLEVAEHFRVGDSQTSEPARGGINRIPLQWRGLAERAHREGKTFRRGEKGRMSIVCPLRAQEGSQGVLILNAVTLGTEEPRILQAMANEIGERLAILKGEGSAMGAGKRGSLESSPDFAQKPGPVAPEDLEYMLFQATKELEKRTRDLEQMTEKWLSVRRFNESVLEGLSSGVIAVDGGGIITHCNRGAERILQYSADEVLGKPLSVAMASKDRRNVLETQLMPDEPFLGRQIQIMRKDGTEIPIGIDIASHRDLRNQEIGKIIHFRDLTRMKEMQEELLRMGRLGSLGEIAMGIAHEIRNPLAGIRITAQALEEEVKSNRGLREYVAKMISEIDRLNELMKSFLSFAKPQHPQLVPCRLPELIQDVLFLVRKDLEKRHIVVEQDHPEDIPDIPMDINQMKQVFLNLILNSLQAVAKGGEIRIRSTMATYGERREVIISVSDTGKGIPREHLAKIFDPFFTTKARGLGMGLSNVYRIIKRHGGYIRVQSEPNQGTTFLIYLPLDSGP